MSYDIDIADDEFNYTYNLSNFFHRHIDGGLYALNGLTGKQALVVMDIAWESITAEKMSHWSSADVGEPKFCEKYDSPNGWGSTVGALVLLGRLTASFANHPRHKIKVF